MSEVQPILIKSNTAKVLIPGWVVGAAEQFMQSHPFTSKELGDFIGDRISETGPVFDLAICRGPDRLIQRHRVNLQRSGSPLRWHWVGR
jgi:hypothetical protein